MDDSPYTLVLRKNNRTPPKRVFRALEFETDNCRVAKSLDEYVLGIDMGAAPLGVLGLRRVKYCAKATFNLGLPIQTMQRDSFWDIGVE